MSQKFTKAQIEELSLALREHFDFHKTIRGKYSTAAKIQFPKVPSIYSETIILELILKKKILNNLDVIDGVLGGNKADILITTPQGEKKIEVKATGESAFQYFGPKDIRADYLIWLHFNKHFSGDGKLPIEIFVLANPAKFFTEARKITLENLKKLAFLKQFTFNMEEIYT